MPDRADGLPPTQYLLIEVLAARYRLGETYWTFPTRCLPTARQLEAAGLVTTRPAGTHGNFEAQLTDVGVAQALSPTHVPPIAEAEQHGYRRAVADAITAVAALRPAQPGG